MSNIIVVLFDNETHSGISSSWLSHSTGMLSDAHSDSEFLSSNIETMIEENETSSSDNASMARGHMPKEMSLIAGYYMIIICVLGIIENILVLNTFRRHPQLKFISSEFIKILCMYDICMGFCAFPFMFISCMANEWIFSDIGCKWYGFSMTAIGAGSISALTCIAIERYVIITGMKHGAVSGMTTARTRKIGALCLFLSIMIALLPFFGVGSYDHEPVFLSCAPAWWSKRVADRVFIVIIFTCVFVVPVCLVVFSYIGICVKVISTKMGQRRRKKYIKLTVMSFLMIGCFLLSWGPYAVFAFLQTTIQDYNLTALQNMIPVMMAKSCILWNPIIYVGINGKFRNVLKSDLRVMIAAVLNKLCRQIKDDRRSSQQGKRENNNESQCVYQFNRNGDTSGTQSQSQSQSQSHKIALETDEKLTLTTYGQESTSLCQSAVVWTRVNPKNGLKAPTLKSELHHFTFIQIETSI